MINWHRLFGLGLTDYFTDSGYEVKVEIDLSIRQQYLDVLIIEQESGSQTSELPDGLENLARRNLVTYKSLRQVLDAWALDELIGHYVNYRKQSSPSLEKLLPVENFGLYAVTTRYPEKLETKAGLEPVKKGIYDIHWGSRQIRIIVLSEVLKIKRNALWLLFSGIAENVQFGALEYEWRRADRSGIFNDLFQHYKAEGIIMPYTWDDYFRERKQEVLEQLTPEERLRGLSLEDILKGLPLEELLKRLPPEELLKRLTREEIEAYLKKLSSSN
jgi:hypothetical protein